eukprot:TRINITY_DN395_c0_g1_i2.p2 TRINITY_DN395_c0_g1~~TRINITY_DN395_c0_g1_i2.p2  ORF type:complete len:128 (-),score=28.28 TRINITY_DN395_c0_g1_i2:683-1066(-)
MLLDLGASPNIKNRRGYTPLHTAILQEQQEMVRLFVNSGGDVRATCKGKNGQELSCLQLLGLNPRLSGLTQIVGEASNRLNLKNEQNLSKMDLDEFSNNSKKEFSANTESISEFTRHDDETYSDDDE